MTDGKKIMVVGCGALGNEVLKCLTLMGARHLTIVDFDTVEIGNLTRSILFRKEDVGRRKVDVVRERLKDLNPDIDVSAIYGDIAHDVGLGVIGDMDIVVGCVDSRWARFMINRHCMRMGKPWVDGGITMTEGTARVFMPGENCYACNLGTEGMEELRRRMPCTNTIRRAEEAGHVPTSVVTASVTGAVMVQEVLKVMAGQQSICGRMACYDADTQEMRNVRFRAYDEDCPEHERWEDNLLRIDFPAATTVGETLRRIGGSGNAIQLRDDVFVDYIYRRGDDKAYRMMCPGRMVTERMDRDGELRGLRLSDFYQNEYREIDAGFPYKELTLKELGIPERDILLVS